MATENNNKTLNVPNKREQSQTCLGYAERKEQSPQGNVPNLRFPEFREEWERIKVSALLEFYPTNSLSWEQLDYSGEGIFNLHYGLIHKGLPTQVDVSENNLPTIKDEYIPKKMSLCQNGDVAFADASEDTNDVAKCIEFANCDEQKIVCGLHTIHGRDTQNKTVTGYKGYAFSARPFREQIRRLAQGTKIYSINSHNFSECYIGIPCKEEQSKISNLLHTIGLRIATQIKIIEDLKKLKSAITHLHFDAAIDKYYSAYIGDCIEQVSQRNKDGKVKEVLSVSNKNGFVNQSEQFEDREIASEDTSNYKVVHTNDFAYNPARINVGSVARLHNYACGIVSPMYICFHTKPMLLPEYFEHIFSTSYFRHEMHKRLEGSVRLCLTYDSLCNIKIALPSIDEQKQFVSQISAIISKIINEDRLLTLYQTLKRYLLSQMFI